MRTPVLHVWIDGAESKTCSKCGEIQSINQFYSSKITTDRLRSACKTCERENNAAAYAKDPERHRARLKKWQEDHPERMAEVKRKRNVSEERKAWVKQWRLAHPEKVIEYVKRRNKKYTESGYWAESYKKKRHGPNRATYLLISRRSNEKKRATTRGVIDHRMTTAIRIALNGGKNKRKWTDLVGYTTRDLIDHLSKTMPHGYSWDRLGELHIDHIIPKSLFRYESVEDSSFKACWALDNLQLLPALENLKKNNKFSVLPRSGGYLCAQALQRQPMAN